MAEFRRQFRNFGEEFEQFTEKLAPLPYRVDLEFLN
jgi:hypothetical protein